MNIETISVGFLGTNCYIVHDGREAVVIDPGAEAERIFEKVRALHLSVKYIFLTHAHFDHVLAVSAIAKETGAPIVSTEGERVRLTDAEVSGHTMLRNRPFTPLTADIEVTDGEKISVGEMTFEFMITPGHTEGSVCIFCEDALFSGDTLFRDTCGRCDLIGGNMEDMFRSLRRIGELEGDFRVFPGHSEKTTLSRERKENPYMAEATRR